MIWRGTAAQKGDDRSVGHRHLSARKKIGERSTLERVQLDFVLTIGTFHWGSRPQFTGEPVRFEVRTIVTEAIHHPRIRGFIGLGHEESS